MKVFIKAKIVGFRQIKTVSVDNVHDIHDEMRFLVKTTEH